MNALVERLEKASYAYHNGAPTLMTDDEYDAAVDQLRAMAPNHPFLTKVGAPVAGDEVVLPIPLPSLNKAKPGGDVAKWLSKNPAPSYIISAKLDGCSALWLPKTRQLFTRGDGTKGRDIQSFAPHFIGFPKADDTIVAVRGELIMRSDSPAIPDGKLARNIVAGALNRQSVDPALFHEIRFVAYELIEPPLSPKEAFRLMKKAGYEVAAAMETADLTDASLSSTFSSAEKVSPYKIDGIVVAPNLAPKKGKKSATNPTDRIAWKTRLTAQTRTTTVREVDWNVSHSGYLIPRVLFDEVEVGGAKIHAATGLHGRWIYDNGIGPGATIEIRRAGDTIPQIVAVHSSTSPSMPPGYRWMTSGSIGVPADGDVHIGPPGGQSTEFDTIRITHALGELGAENVGPGMVAKLYAAGFRTVGAIYAASAADFAGRVDGCKDKMAVKIYEGLRAKKSWDELDFLVASSTMPRSVGRIKLQPLLAAEPNVQSWTATMAPPPGLSQETIRKIVEAIPTYLAWRAENLAWVSPASASASDVVPNPNPKPNPHPHSSFVMTGVRDKAVEESGITLTSTVTKKTTAVIYPDGPLPSSGKITRAQELNIPTIQLSEFRAKYL